MLPKPAQKEYPRIPVQVAFLIENPGRFFYEKFACYKSYNLVFLFEFQDSARLNSNLPCMLWSFIDQLFLHDHHILHRGNHILKILVNYDS